MSSGSVPKGGDGDLLRDFIMKMEKMKGKASDQEVLDQVVKLMNTMDDFGCTE